MTKTSEIANLQWTFFIMNIIQQSSFSEIKKNYQNLKMARKWSKEWSSYLVTTKWFFKEKDITGFQKNEKIMLIGCE